VRVMHKHFHSYMQWTKKVNESVMQLIQTQPMRGSFNTSRVHTVQKKVEFPSDWLWSWIYVEYPLFTPNMRNEEYHLSTSYVFYLDQIRIGCLVPEWILQGIYPNVIQKRPEWATFWLVREVSRRRFLIDFHGLHMSDIHKTCLRDPDAADIASWSIYSLFSDFMQLLFQEMWGMDVFIYSGQLIHTDEFSRMKVPLSYEDSKRLPDNILSLLLDVQPAEKDSESIWTFLDKDESMIYQCAQGLMK